MEKVIFFNQTTSLAERVAIPFSPGIYIEGSLYDGLIAKVIDSTVDNQELLEQRHLDSNGDVATNTVRPSPQHELVNNVWVEALTDTKDSESRGIRDMTFQHVTVTSGFNSDLQSEYNDDWLELKDKETQMTLTQAEEDRLDHIRSVRQWKIALLANRDGVITSINAATNTTEIDTAVAAMVYIAAPSGIV